MDLAFALRSFVRTVECGSMTAAARDLGISQPAVSKLLRNLEAHTGARLLERNSRGLRPTEQGLALFEASGDALSTIDAAIEALRANDRCVSGKLVLHGPACIGERHLHAIVMTFQDRHPAVSVDLRIENQSADLIQDNIDIAVRMGQPTGQDLIAKRIGFSRRILVASPEYLARRGGVEDCLALADHDLIVTNASLSSRGMLSLRKDDSTMKVRVAPKLTTNNAQVLVNALKAHRGIGTAQVLLVADALRDGTLVQVLPDHAIEPTDLYLTYPSAKFLRPTVRAFINFAIPALRGIDGIVATSTVPSSR